jgi:pyrimidine operon attenuation protein/uracil phosphoribosyltransferase
VDRLSGAEELALVGIRRGGAPIAVHLASLIEKKHGNSSTYRRSGHHLVP